VEIAAKQRAVDLLKAYIELQEAENRHLTKALNLATLAQTQRTDRYIDDEVKHLRQAKVTHLRQEVRHLRQAVGDEAAIETLRGMIRADEDGNVEDRMEEQDGGENTDQEEDEEDYSDDTPALDYVPVKREVDSGEVFLPQTLEEDAGYDRDDAEEYERSRLLRERLRQYLLKEKLDAIRDRIGDEGDYDFNDEWWMSKLSPEYADVYSGFILFCFPSLTKIILKFSCTYILSMCDEISDMLIRAGNDNGTDFNPEGVSP